jgi:uncharacterized protein YjbJ (UPF0337 family)
MNSDPVKTKEAAFAGQMKEKWGALTDGDLEGIAGRKGPLVGKLRERYGYGQEQAEREADEFLHGHPELNGALSSGKSEPALVQAASPQTHQEEPAPGAPTVFVATDASQLRAEAKGLPDASYSHSVTVWIGPRILRWIVPAAVVALFTFLFLPWTGAYPSGYPAYTQNAFQTILGGVSEDPVAIQALDSAKPYDKIETNPLMLLYVLSVMLALVLVLAPLVLTPLRVKIFPQFVDSIWRRRVGLLGAAALTTFLALMIQLWMGFGLESSVAAKADKNQAAELAAAKTPEEREKANIHRGLEVSPLNLSRTRWLHLAVFCNAVFLGGVALEFWLKRRGDRPLPRIEAQA